MTTTIKQLENWAIGEVKKVENDLEAAWVAMKPGIISLGETVLSQIAQAAETYVLSGGKDFAAAVAAVVAALPADAKILEEDIAAGIAAAVKAATGQSAPQTAV